MKCPLQIAELELSLTEMVDIMRKYAKKTEEGSSFIWDGFFFNVAEDLKNYFIKKLNSNIYKEVEETKIANELIMKIFKEKDIK